MASKIPLAGIRNKILGSGPVSRISVSNFAASICEIKSLYQKMKYVGSEPSQATINSLKFGNKTHEKLDNMEKVEVEIPPLSSQSIHLPQALKLCDTANRWSQLTTRGSGREIPLFGEYKGIKLYGIADGFELNKNKLDIVENKTTFGRLPPQEYKMRLAYHQALMYRYMFEGMMDPEFDLLKYIRIDGVSPEEEVSPLVRFRENGGLQVITVGDQEIYPDEFSLETIYNKLVEGLNILRFQYKKNEWALSDRIVLRYTNRSETQSYELEYDPEVQKQLLEYSGNLWLGLREPSPFRSDGNLTCSWCNYLDTCEFVSRGRDIGVHIE